MIQDKLSSRDMKRDPDKIRKYLKKTGNMIVAGKDLIVMFPEKFVDKELSIIGSDSYVLGIFIIVDEELNYSVSKIPGRVKIQPAEIESVTIDDVPYVALRIQKDTDLISDINVIKDNSFVYDMFELMIIQGKVPFFLNYHDLPDIFSKLNKYTGSRAGNVAIAYELLTAIIARDKNNPMVEYRNIVKDKKEYLKNYPYFVGLSNIWYTFNSTLSKVAGSYMKLGIVSSILYPEKEISDLEHVIRE